MSFESVLKNSLLSDIGLGKSRYTHGYTHNYEIRQNVSKSRVDLYDSVRYLLIGSTVTLRYENETSVRYIAAEGMSYDTILSLYDINSRSLFVARFVSFDDKIKQQVEQFIGSIKIPTPRYEARIIGMQNSEEYKDLYKIADMLSVHKIGLYEIDLFGTDVRNIALDAKLGVSYNVLMENRLYRPGELMNKTTIEQFEKELKEQVQQSKA